MRKFLAHWVFFYVFRFLFVSEKVKADVITCIVHSFYQRQKYCVEYQTKIFLRNFFALSLTASPFPDFSFPSKDKSKTKEGKNYVFFLQCAKFLRIYLLQSAPKAHGGILFMKTAVIYARYSSDRQTEQSIEGQLRDCREFAERNNILIVDTYIDRAMTGTNDNREAFQKMLKDSDKKAWDYVLVYKLDRFSRNKYEMAIHRKHLKDNGVKILSAKENIPDSPEGILLESLLEGMNQYYSEELSQKTNHGLRETRLKGNFPGGQINFGFSVLNHKVVINETEAPVVLQIFSDYANGKRLIDIVSDLNSKGIRNKGRPFNAHSVYYLLESERYIGIYKNHGIVYDNIFPAIVPKDVFDIVQKRIVANKYGKHVLNVDYLLKGRIFCGYCGKLLTSYTGTSKNGKIWRYYNCRSIKKDTGCQSKAIGKEFIETTVIDVLTKAITKPENYSLLISAIMEKQRKTLSDDAELHILEKELQRISKALTNLLNAIEVGIYTETTKNRLQELETQKRDIEEKILAERSRVKDILSESDIEKYLKYALKQKAKNMIDLLLEKATVFTDKIYIDLKYVKGNPPNHPKRNKSNDSPERNISSRGCPVLSFNAVYETTVILTGRKSHIQYQKQKPFQIFIFV